jgi:hypothetical protein
MLGYPRGEAKVQADFIVEVFLALQASLHEDSIFQALLQQPRPVSVRKRQIKNSAAITTAATFFCFFKGSVLIGRAWRRRH